MTSLNSIARTSILAKRVSLNVSVAAIMALGVRLQTGEVPSTPYCLPRTRLASTDGIRRQRVSPTTFCARTVSDSPWTPGQTSALTSRAEHEWVTQHELLVKASAHPAS